MALGTIQVVPMGEDPAAPSQTSTIPYHTPFTEGCAGANKKPRPLAVIRNRRLNNGALLDPLRQWKTAMGCKSKKELALGDGNDEDDAYGFS